MPCNKRREKTIPVEHLNLVTFNLQSYADDKMRKTISYVSGVDFFSMSVCQFVKIKTACTKKKANKKNIEIK